VDLNFAPPYSHCDIGEWIFFRLSKIIYVFLTFIFYRFVALLSYAVILHYEMFSADADIRLARRIKRDTADNARDIGAVLDQVGSYFPATPFALPFSYFDYTFFFYFAFVILTFTEFQDFYMLF